MHWAWSCNISTLRGSESPVVSGLNKTIAFIQPHSVGSGGRSLNLIKGGGARLNDVKVDDETATATLADLNPDGTIKLSAGKKRHALVRVVD